MKTVVLSMSLLLWILCLQQYCFLGTVNAVPELNHRDNCTRPEQCQSQNLTCLNGTCQCESGFYFNATGCLRQLNHRDNCTRPEQCQSQNLTCLNGTCQCESGFYFNATEGCRRQLNHGDNCTLPKQCQSQNLTCLDGICQCESGIYFNASESCRRQREIFESCNETEKNLGVHVECKQNNRSCEDQDYQGYCLPKLNHGDNCILPEQCQSQNLTCLNGTCQCESGFYFDATGGCLRQKNIGEHCASADECSPSNSSCINDTCDCTSEFYLNLTMCLPQHELFKPCTDPKQCIGDNVQCKENNCTCMNKYYHQNDSCYAKKGINENCFSTMECLDENTVCQDKKCKCDIEYFYKTDEKCVRRLEPGAKCDFHKMCKTLSRCKNNKCECKEDHYRSGTVCLQRLGTGAQCQFDKMCKTLSRCKYNKCECKEDHYRAGTVCFQKGKYGVVCSNMNECLGENVYCSNRCTCIDGYEYQGSFCKKKSPNALVIIMVILIIILFCVLAYVLWKIKKQKSADLNPSTKGTPMELNIPRCRPILMSKFPETVDAMHQDSNKVFAENFMDLSRINPLILTGNSDQTSSTKYLPCHEAKKSANARKNRFLDILPFDYSRVKLQQVEDDPDSAYINASYIAGYSGEKEYIAAQGPLPNTSTDFWRMVWEENVSIIVMLTLCKEKDMNKCDNYWPLEEDSRLDFDDISVETNNVTDYDSYEYRSMTLKIDDTTRSLKHFHFLNWADFTANVPIEILISFIRNVRLHITSNTPVVIHCSAGVGRTGTFIAVDYLLQFVDANPLDSNIDIFQLVSKMRERRVHMVQNKKQYILIHDCIKHVVKKKIALEYGEPDDGDNGCPYENGGFVTIDLTDKAKDEKTSQNLGSVQVTIEDKGESEEEEESEEENEEETEEESEENPYENEIHVQMSEEKNEENQEEENPYENEIQVQMTSEEKNEENQEEENPYENQVQMTSEEKNEENQEEENPYENQGLSNAEKDCPNDYESDDTSENAMLINKDETQSDKSNKDPSEEQPNLVIVGGEDVEEENPYENQDFVEAGEKQKLTNL